MIFCRCVNGELIGTEHQQGDQSNEESGEVDEDILVPRSEEISQIISELENNQGARKNG